MIHRLVDHSQTFSDRKRSHINGLEGFWGYLKRRLAAKGGIWPERPSTRQSMFGAIIIGVSWSQNREKLAQVAPKLIWWLKRDSTHKDYEGTRRIDKDLVAA